jgi:hypothetical protein
MYSTLIAYIGTPAARAIASAGYSAIRAAYNRIVGTTSNGTTMAKPAHSVRRTTRIGKFKKRKRTAKPGVMGKYGSVLVQERGGILEQTDPRGIVLIGHTTFNRNEMLGCVSRGIVRKLCKQAGWEFSSWDEVIPGIDATYTIEASSFDGISDAGAGSSFGTCSTTTTYTVLAQLLAVAITNRQGSGSFNVLYDQFLLKKSGEVLGSLRAREMKLEFYCTSKLTLQNRTPSSSGASSEDNANDIEHNPLVGFRYNGLGNGFVPKHSDPTDDSARFHGGVADGLIAHLPDASELDNLYKPPAPTFWMNCSKNARVKLEPGVVKSSFLFYKKVMMVNTWAKLFGGNLERLKAGSTDKVRVTGLGQAEMFALDKVLDTRELTEPNVKIGYELNQSFGCRVLMAEKQGTAKIMNVL